MRHSKIVDVKKEPHQTEVTFKNSQGKKFDYTFHNHDDTNETAGLTKNGIDNAGLWFEKKTLVDYDGVFELTAQAIITIRKAGFRVPRDYEPNSIIILTKKS
jgi:hypothetical protein